MGAQRYQQLRRLLQLLCCTNSGKKGLAPNNRSMIGKHYGVVPSVQCANVIAGFWVAGFHLGYQFDLPNAHHDIGRDRWNTVVGVDICQA